MSTAPTAWPRTRCSTGWCSGPGSSRPSPPVSTAPDRPAPCAASSGARPGTVRPRSRAGRPRCAAPAAGAAGATAPERRPGGRPGRAAAAMTRDAACCGRRVAGAGRGRRRPGRGGGAGSRRRAHALRNLPPWPPRCSDGRPDRKRRPRPGRPPRHLGCGFATSSAATSPEAGDRAAPPTPNRGHVRRRTRQAPGRPTSTPGLVPRSPGRHDTVVDGTRWTEHAAARPPGHRPGGAGPHRRPGTEKIQKDGQAGISRARCRWRHDLHRAGAGRTRRPSSSRSTASRDLR